MSCEAGHTPDSRLRINIQMSATTPTPPSAFHHHISVILWLLEASVCNRGRRFYGLQVDLSATFLVLENAVDERKR